LAFRLCGGPGRLRDVDTDPVAVDAAAAKPVLALAITVVVAVLTVAAFVRRKPEFRPGVQWRPVVEPGLGQRWSTIKPGLQWRWTVVQPGLQWWPEFQPGRRSGIAIPDEADERRRRWFGREHAGKQFPGRHELERVIGRRIGQPIRQLIRWRIRQQRFERPAVGRWTVSFDRLDRVGAGFVLGPGIAIGWKHERRRPNRKQR
jgi:hypothetical protein